MQQSEQLKLVFLDRDGVICENRDDYVKSWEEFAWIPRAKEAIKRLTDEGYIIVVVTNQSSVGRGIISLAVLEDIHNRMLREIELVGGKIHRIYYCPHHPDEKCNCRKPKPGLLLKAKEHFNIDFAQTYMIGDTLTDIKAGHKVKAKTILVLTGRGKTELEKQNNWKVYPDYIVSDLYEAVNLITKRS